MVHVDFLRISLDDEVHVTVPLLLTGKAIGVTNGGNLHQSMYTIAIASTDCGARTPAANTA